MNRRLVLVPSPTRTRSPNPTRGPTRTRLWRLLLLRQERQPRCASTVSDRLRAYCYCSQSLRSTIGDWGLPAQKHSDLNECSATISCGGAKPNQSAYLLLMRTISPPALAVATYIRRSGSNFYKIGSQLLRTVNAALQSKRLLPDARRIDRRLTLAKRRSSTCAIRRVRTKPGRRAGRVCAVG